MERKANFIIVGLFAFIGTLSLAYFIYWLGKYGLENRQYSYYQTDVAESVSGLKSSSPVKLQGIDVGMVESIVLDDSDPQIVHITFKVFEETPVKTDTVARLNSQGIAGTAFLELKGGTKQSTLLKGSSDKRGLVPSEPSTMTRLLSHADKLVASVDMTLQRVQQTMSDQNVRNFSTILENGSKFSSNLQNHSEKFSDLMEKTAAFETNASMTLASIGQTNAKAQELIESAKGASDNTNALIQDINRSNIVSKLSGVLDNTNHTLTSTQETVAETKMFVKELREHPSGILFK